ncbi:MAG: hypothetical protein JRE38_09970 [Deltaproteobacteria bacterium]|nr:hypothetical protein [Deltaproteobacteria bacterium]MBW2691600.1 hypothetical protein [Deltaproteobacteria bacterium]
MLFSESIWKVSPALLATAALILITGVAGAVFNADRTIDPNSPNFNGSGGWVDGSGEDYSTGVYFFCGSLNDSFEIGCYSEHPDNVTISSNQGKVDQKKTDNNARAYMNVAELGGITVNTEFDLDCKKVQLKGKSNDNTDRIESKCTLTKCQIPGALSPDQIASAQQCIEEQEDAGNIGKKVTSLKLDNNNLLKGKIWSRGVWQERF